ncbi:MAG: hypothetical protein KC561_09575 [Myxococcales bacterium]|nr:hypothetical protein [Myxococcales bacterium]
MLWKLVPSLPEGATDVGGVEPLEMLALGWYLSVIPALLGLFGALAGLATGKTAPAG